MSFLTAQWRKLAIVNYEVDPSILMDYLPYGTEIDFYKGRCYLSLVAFMFKDTKVLGCYVPFHINFEEVNLRFYVKSKSGGKDKRGVVFVKEFVPRKAISFIANLFYKEHYEATAMNHLWQFDKEHLTARYYWKYHKDWYNLSITANSSLNEIIKGSEEEFITEHYYGYTRISPSLTYEYEVKHPRWATYPIEKYEVDVDFEKVYGKKFKELNFIQPSSVLLAEGSGVSVENKRSLLKLE